MKKESLMFATGIPICIIILIVVALISMRNDIISKEESITQQWSEVENQLQRRYDLIPNLVSTVKGYVKHEESVFIAISDARKAVFDAKGINDKAKAETYLNVALNRLIVVAENYPNLKSNENFIRLQDELAGTENRISVARKRYNDSVANFNKSIKTFPGNLFGFTQKEYFNPPAKGKMEETPNVEF